MSDCNSCDKFNDEMPCYDEFRFCEKSLAEHDRKVTEDAIDRFVEVLNNIFWCRHDMAEIRALAEKFKEKNDE